MLRLLRLNENLKFNITNHNRNVVAAICIQEIKRLIDNSWFSEDKLLLSKLLPALYRQLVSDMPMKIEFENLPIHRMKMIIVRETTPSFTSLETDNNLGFMDMATGNSISLEDEDEELWMLWSDGRYWLFENEAPIELPSIYRFFYDRTPNKEYRNDYKRYAKK